MFQELKAVTHIPDVTSVIDVHPDSPKVPVTYNI